MNAEERLYKLITEELSKTEVNTMISNKLDSNLSSREFKKKVKEIAADVVSELFKLLWQRNNFWKSSVSN